MRSLTLREGEKLVLSDGEVHLCHEGCHFAKGSELHIHGNAFLHGNQLTEIPL
jgi:hypothetical protein